MNAPRISVILPTRNRATLLRRAMDSVLGQSFHDLELIVVDDASTDSTPQLLAACSDSRLRILRREHNRGAAAARNWALSEARGEWVAFQDDDDLWLVQRLETQWAAVSANPGCEWSLCSYVRLDQGYERLIGGREYYDQLMPEAGIGDEGPDWSLIATPGWLVRRSVLEAEGGFDERMRSWDDWELALRLLRRRRPLHVDQPLWVQDWRQGSGLIRRERARADDLRQIMEKHADLWKGHRRVQARHWHLIGRIQSLYDAPPAGRRELWRAIALTPWRLRFWLSLISSYLGPEANMRLTQVVRRLKAAQ
jgi:glycosyltransferase involved in cell wall biosynthesis